MTSKTQAMVNAECSSAALETLMGAHALYMDIHESQRATVRGFIDLFPQRKEELLAVMEKLDQAKAERKKALDSLVLAVGIECGAFIENKCPSCQGHHEPTKTGESPVTCKG